MTPVTSHYFGYKPQPFTNIDLKSGFCIIAFVILLLILSKKFLMRWQSANGSPHLPEEYRAQAIANALNHVCDFKPLDFVCQQLSDVIYFAFIWGDTPEGYAFWDAKYLELKFPAVPRPKNTKGFGVINQGFLKWSKSAWLLVILCILTYENRKRVVWNIESHIEVRLWRIPDLEH